MVIIGEKYSGSDVIQLSGSWSTSRASWIIRKEDPRELSYDIPFVKYTKYKDEDGDCFLFGDQQLDKSPNTIWVFCLLELE